MSHDQERQVSARGRTQDYGEKHAAARSRIKKARVSARQPNTQIRASFPKRRSLWPTLLILTRWQEGHQQWPGLNRHRGRKGRWRGRNWSWGEEDRRADSLCCLTGAPEGIVHHVYTWMAWEGPRGHTNVGPGWWRTTGLIHGAAVWIWVSLMKQNDENTWTSQVKWLDKGLNGGCRLWRRRRSSVHVDAVPLARGVHLGGLRVFLHRSARQRANQIEKVEDVPPGPRTQTETTNVEKRKQLWEEDPKLKILFSVPALHFRK